MIGGDGTAHNPVHDAAAAGAAERGWARIEAAIDRLIPVWPDGTLRDRATGSQSRASTVAVA